MRKERTVTVEAVRERERELYFIKSKNSFKNICFEKDSNKA